MQKSFPRWWKKGKARPGNGEVVGGGDLSTRTTPISGSSITGMGGFETVRVWYCSNQRSDKISREKTERIVGRKVFYMRPISGAYDPQKSGHITARLKRGQAAASASVEEKSRLRADIRQHEVVVAVVFRSDNNLRTVAPGSYPKHKGGRVHPWRRSFIPVRSNFWKGDRDTESDNDEEETEGKGIEEAGRHGAERGQHHDDGRGSEEGRSEIDATSDDDDDSDNDGEKPNVTDKGKANKKGDEGDSDNTEDGNVEKAMSEEEEEDDEDERIRARAKLVIQKAFAEESIGIFAASVLTLLNKDVPKAKVEPILGTLSCIHGAVPTITTKRWYAHLCNVLATTFSLASDRLEITPSQVRGSLEKILAEAHRTTYYQYM